MASPLHRSLHEEPDPSYCQAICDVACELHNLCPSPSPPPPSTPAAGDRVSTNIRFHHHSAILPALPVAAGSFLAGAILLLVAVLFLVRRRRRRERASAPQVVDADGDFFFEDGGHEVDHHVWYIRTVGLDESTIGAITAWAYRSGEDGVLGSSVADCAICLGEFRDGEILRLLPKCGHAFHQPCIDTWLRSRVNCPLCRAPVVAPNSSASATNSSSERLVNIDSSPFLSSSRRPPSAAPESANSRLAESANSPLESIRGVSEQEMDSGRLGFQLQDGILNDQAMGSELRVSSSGLKAIHRSPSMDSLPLSTFIFHLDSEERSIEEGIGPDFEEGQVQKNRGEQEHAPKRGSFLKETERSFSSVSRRFSLSRTGHARSSILPL